MAQEPSQYDDTASDTAMLWNTLKALDPAIRRLGLSPTLIRSWDEAIYVAHTLMVRTDGTAELMRDIIRLTRRGKLDRKSIARLKAYEQAYPSELAEVEDEVLQSFIEVQGEAELPRAVPVMVYPEVRNHGNRYSTQSPTHQPVPEHRPSV